jgi:hypothetical protein
MSGTIRAGETIPKLRLRLPPFPQLWTKSGIKNDDPSRVPARNDSAEDMKAAVIIVPARLFLTGLNRAFNLSQES